MQAFRGGRSRRYRMAARDLRRLRLLPARSGKSLPKCALHRMGSRWRLCRMGSRSAKTSPIRCHPTLGDEETAPLLCAGIIGYRAIKRAGVQPGATVGLYGFGGSAHIAIQVLKYWGCRVFVMSRGGKHQELAEELGADWTGEAAETPPAAARCRDFVRAGRQSGFARDGSAGSWRYSVNRGNLSHANSDARLRAPSVQRKRDSQRHRQYAR